MQNNALFEVARRGHCSLLRRKFKFATCQITRVALKVLLVIMTYISAHAQTLFSSVHSLCSWVSSGWFVTSKSSLFVKGGTLLSQSQTSYRHYENVLLCCKYTYVLLSVWSQVEALEPIGKASGEVTNYAILELYNCVVQSEK